MPIGGGFSDIGAPINRGLEPLQNQLRQREEAKKRGGVYDPGDMTGLTLSEQQARREQAKKDWLSRVGENPQGENVFSEAEKDYQNRQADKLRQTQIDTASKLEKDAPEIANRAFGAAAIGERRNLAGQMADIQRGASRRGLLYSGMKQGAEAGAQAGSAARLAQARIGINRDVGQMVQDAKSKVIQGGLDMQSSQQAMEDAVYSKALSNYQSRVAGAGAIGGGLGMVGGAFLKGF